MKIVVVDFIIQCTIDPELIGNFENSFYAHNFENCLKRKQDWNSSDQQLDSRLTRVSSNVESYNIHKEIEDFKYDEEYIFQMALARAKEYS